MASGLTLAARRWRRFLALSAPFWRSSERWRAGVLLAALIALLLGQTVFNLSFVELSGELTSALAARDGERFWHAIRTSLIVLAAAVPIWALYYRVRDTLALHWRRWMTHQFLEHWLAHRAYYTLTDSGDIDNPDQRIAEDVATFTQQSLFFSMIALGALIQLAAFTTMLWSISRELVFFLGAYALLGTLGTMLIFGRPLVRLNFLQLRREGDFRFALVRIREHAEPIALMRGEHDETAQARTWYEAVFENTRALIRRQFGLNLFQYAFSFLTIVLPSAIIAHRVLSGELEVGAAVQAGGAFTAILSALSVVVDHFEGLSRLSAGVDRLHDFSQRLDDAAAAPTDGSRIDSAPAQHLRLDRLTVCTPGHERVLVRDLSLTLAPGTGLLIVGGSGGGKSSLLRAIGGLWLAGSGRIERPPDEQLMFLPQQPYMVLGSLRRQLLYPISHPNGQAESHVPDSTLHALLAQVNLTDLPQRFGGLDAVLDWAKVLSIGEQQRLAFARVLRARPLFAMLDEATSALDCANESILYTQLASTRITPVSVSHRPGLLPFHRQVLELPGDGTWRVMASHDYAFS
jgi:putative ATP-binding cassette transporter